MEKYIEEFNTVAKGLNQNKVNSVLLYIAGDNNQLYDLLDRTDELSLEQYNNYVAFLENLLF